jgi:hypothetical protein
VRVDRPGARRHLPPAGAPTSTSQTSHRLVEGHDLADVYAVAIVGFGHSIRDEWRRIAGAGLSRSRNLASKARGFVIFSPCSPRQSFFATAIIPDSIRPQFYDNLISGPATPRRPLPVRLPFQAFVVVVGFLILPRGQYGHCRLERRAQSSLKTAF